METTQNEGTRRPAPSEPMQQLKPAGRPRLNANGGRKPLKRTTGSYTNQLKLDAATHLERYGDVKATIKLFWPNLDKKCYESRRKLVSDWKRNKAKLVKACSTSAGKLRKKERKPGTATIIPKDAELEIVDWVNDLRQEGVPISTLMLQLKADEVATAWGVEKFYASWNWQDKFKNRHNLSMRSRTRQGQKPPEELQAICAAFAATVSATMDRLGISTVYNADQTAAFFEYLPKKTLNKRGPKTVWVRCAGKSKERATVMLFGDNHGRKYTSFVVFKAQPSKGPKRILENKQKRRGFGIYVWEEIEELHEAYDLEFFGNPKGWWNHELSVEFLHFHFGEREDMQMPVLLLWDDFSGHWTEDVLQCARELNVELLKVPEGATSVAQPADVAWNAPLKSRMRGLWINFLREQLQRHAKDSGDPFRMEPPNRRIVANWIAQGWEMLSPATIANGFKKCGYPCVQDADHVGAALADEEVADEVIAELQKLHFVDESYGDIDSDADFDRTE